MRAINKTRMTKYKPSAIYKKLRNHFLIFMRLFTSFIVQNYKKISKTRSRVLRRQYFPVRNDLLILNKIFFAKTTNINFICLLAPFIVKNFFKSLECIRSFQDNYNFGPKMTHLPQPSIILEKPFKFHVPFALFYCAKLKYDFNVPLGHFQCAKF